MSYFRYSPRSVTGDRQIAGEIAVKTVPPPVYKPQTKDNQMLNVVLLLYLYFLQGAAFGFSSIAAHSREQLEPYLPKIVPKLFR